MNALQVDSAQHEFYAARSGLFAEVPRRSKMIIQSKIQGRGFQIRSVRAVGAWSVALLCGSIVAACSGTIETPTEEFPPREGGSNSQAQTNDDDNDTPPRTPTPSANNNDDDDVPAGNEEDPPAGNEEDPPAGNEEDPPAGNEEDPPASSDLTFEADILPIFSTTCGPCHAGGATAGVDIGNPDVDTAFSEAVRVEDRVIARITAGTMPPPCSGGDPGDSGCMSAEDFETVQAWYDAGAPE